MRTRNIFGARKGGVNHGKKFIALPPYSELKAQELELHSKKKSTQARRRWVRENGL